MINYIFTLKNEIATFQHCIAINKETFDCNINLQQCTATLQHYIAILHGNNALQYCNNALQQFNNELQSYLVFGVAPIALLSMAVAAPPGVWVQVGQDAVAFLCVHKTIWHVFYKNIYYSRSRSFRRFRSDQTRSILYLTYQSRKGPFVMNAMSNF